MSIAFCSGQYSNIIVLCRGLGKGMTSPFKGTSVLRRASRCRARNEILGALHWCLLGGKRPKKGSATRFFKGALHRNFGA